MDRINVLEMISELEAGFMDRELFLKRNSWSAAGTVFQYMGTSPDWKEWHALKPPYFNNVPKVWGVVFWAASGRYEAHVLSCPGTYAYHAIGRPDWWNPPDELFSLNVGNVQVHGQTIRTRVRPAQQAMKVGDGGAMNLARSNQPPSPRSLRR